MQDLKRKVAVITGAASGIGFGMACAFARRGMRLVLADIESAALSAATNEFVNAGIEVIAERVDVSDAQAVEDLAAHAYAAFGEVNVVCNNAGVIENNLPTWEYSIEDWNWVLGVNLMGVVHGIRAFIPRMIESGAVGHVVNTASFGGLIAGTANPIYTVSKHAVVAMSENLHNDLRVRDTSVNVSVLCPGWVRTDIVGSDRNRNDAPPLSEIDHHRRARFQQGIESGLEPEAVGDLVVSAIEDGRFYIQTHPDWIGVVRDRFDAIENGLAPAKSRIPNPKSPSTGPAS